MLSDDVYTEDVEGGVGRDKISSALDYLKMFILHFGTLLQKGEIIGPRGNVIAILCVTNNMSDKNKFF